MQQMEFDHFIATRDLGHQYVQGQHALQGINLEIGEGVFGLLGANGAGKSTLMNILCTLLEPSAGEVSICGYNALTERDQVRRILGYLPQDFGAWRQFKVAEVLDTLAALSGLHNKTQRLDKIAQLIDAVGLSKVTDRAVKHLSGGMLRRLGVAQALLHDPQIIVMDEPTVGLDPEERQRFRHLIADIAKQRAVILSTHIVSDLGVSCNDIALINAGKLAFRNTPQQLMAQAQGNVFQCTLSPGDAQQLEARTDIEIVARHYQEGMCVLRGIHKNQTNASNTTESKQGLPDNTTQAENITLEEAYLCFILQQGWEVSDDMLAS